MKRVNLVLLAAAVSLVMFGPASAAKIKLSYANFPSALTFPCVQMEHWKQQVEKRTNGKVAIHTFPGGILLGAKEMLDGVIAGTADIGALCMAYQPGRFVLTNATSLPLGIPNALVGSQVLWELHKKYQPSAFAKVKVLTMFTSAPSNIMSKKAVRVLDDLKGLDLRASGGAAMILKAWGANQVGMPMSATPEALQKGIVQGLFSSLEVMKDLKFAELCKYVTITDTVIYPFAVVMNMDVWNRLPKDVQQVMDNLGPKQVQWTGSYMDNHVQEAMDWSCEQHGVEVIRLSPQQKTAWDAMLNPMLEQWIAATKARGLPASEIIADIRALTSAYAR